MNSATAKFDPIPCVAAAYRSLFSNAVVFGFLLGGWTALALAAWFMTLAAVRETFSVYPAVAENFASWDERMQGIALVMPAIVLVWAGTISVIVALHRVIIQGVIPASPFPTGLGDIGRYFVRLVVVTGVPLVPLALGGFFAARLVLNSMEGQLSRPVLMVLIFGVMVGVAAICMRLSLILPASVAGDRSMTLRRSWILTRGNSWRLFWGAFLSALPFAFASNVLEAIVKSAPETDGISVGDGLVVVGILLEIVGYLLAAGFVSHAYLHFSATTAFTEKVQRQTGAV
jgi:hypothetical protein